MREPDYGWSGMSPHRFPAAHPWRALAIAAAIAVAAASAASSREAVATTARPAKFHLTSSLIKLGRSIGDVRLGMTTAEVARFLGPGQLANRKRHGRVSFYLYGDKSTGTYTALFAGQPRKAVALGEQTGVMHTSKDIRVGSALADLQLAYPALHCDNGVTGSMPVSLAHGNCDLDGPSGHATRFAIASGEVAGISVAEKRWLSTLK